MAERLAEDLWRLDIPLVGNPLKNLNSYLLTGERSLLIDTGFRQQSCREHGAPAGGDARGPGPAGHFLHPPPQRPHRLAPELIRPGCRISIGRSTAPA
ncbi:MAG: hypothetical protein ACLTYN_12055 [Dysosmobacter welbionis]